MISSYDLDLSGPIEKNKNILFILHSGIDTNSGYHAQLYALDLTEQGQDCAFAIPDFSYKKKFASQYKRQKIFSFSFFFSEEVDFPFDNGQFPDIIHAWTPREHVRELAEYLSNKTNAALVIHLEDNEEYLLSARLKKDFLSLEKFSKKELDQLVPHTAYHPITGREFLEKSQGITLLISSLARFNSAQLPQLVLPPPVDERLFFPRAPNYKLRKQLNIDQQTLVIPYTGNIHYANREEVLELHRTIIILNENGHSSILLRTGENYAPLTLPGWKPEYLRNLGWIERAAMPEVLAAGDILVQPGVPNAFNEQRIPSKLPEYFMMGKPVVLPKTNIGLEVEQGVEGYVLEKADALSIAKAIVHIKTNQNLARQLSEGSLKFYKRKFSKAKRGNILNNFYNKILS